MGDDDRKVPAANQRAGEDPPAATAEPTPPRTTQPGDVPTNTVAATPAVVAAPGTSETDTPVTGIAQRGKADGEVAT